MLKVISERCRNCPAMTEGKLWNCFRCQPAPVHDRRKALLGLALVVTLGVGLAVTFADLQAAMITGRPAEPPTSGAAPGGADPVAAPAGTASGG